MFDLTNRTIIVTGALGLLGKNHCRALAGQGASVVVADVNGPAAEDFAGQLGGKHFGVGIDVTSRASLETARDAILAKYGHIDGLINNAAINDMFESPTAAAELSMFENYPLELFQKSIDVNVTGVFLASQVLGTPMAKAGKGSIVNIASTYGMVGPDQSIYVRPDGSQPFFKSPAYPTTKGAVLNFTRYLAAYWGKSGVRVNSLSPGGVGNGQEEYFVKNYSEKTMLGRMAKPDEMGGAIVFLVSDASAYMTGANLVVDGGWTAW
jgi:NAD(P)-dependent dehydrogenase (short-subunit alcohol dehydrogenase family)